MNPKEFDRIARRHRRAKRSQERLVARGLKPCPLCGRYNTPAIRCTNCGADIGAVFQ